MIIVGIVSAAFVISEFGIRKKENGEAVLIVDTEKSKRKRRYPIAGMFPQASADSGRKRYGTCHRVKGRRPEEKYLYFRYGASD